MSYTLFPDNSDSALQRSARTIGEMILRGSGAAIAKGSGASFAAMPSWMKNAHLRAAAQSSARDIGRLAGLAGPNSVYAKSTELLEEAQRIEQMPRGEFRAALEKKLERKAEEIAAHEDRPSRDNALSAEQHRELARMHEVRSYIEQESRNTAGARAHEAAADAHHRAAALASEHDPESPFASHRARQATRRANRLCHEHVDLPHPHANKSADGMSHGAGRLRETESRDPYRSQVSGERPYREPRGNPDAFRESGRIYSTEFESGYDYDADAPAHPMSRLFGPAQNAAAMNWPRDPERDHDDFGPHHSTTPRRGNLNWHEDDGIRGNMPQRHMTEGRVPRYRADRPYGRTANGGEGNPGRSFRDELDGKSAGFRPGGSLTQLSAALMASGTPLAKVYG